MAGEFRDGCDFLLYDGGEGAGPILLLGAKADVRAPKSATVRAADGAFMARPRLRAQLYTIRAR